MKVSIYSRILGGAVQRAPALAAIPAICASAAMADVGTVVQISDGQIIRNGQPIASDVGTLVEEGDVLSTEIGGMISIEMIDGTRFVVYSDSTINIDTALVGSNTNAFESLAVGISSGILRTISGNSPNSAYEVSTPNATMGIRGTNFDVNERGTDTLVLITEGAVGGEPTDDQGNPVPAQGIVNVDLCELLRFADGLSSVITDRQLDVNMPSAFFSQGAFPSGFGTNSSCDEGELSDELDDVFSGTSVEETFQQNLEDLNTQEDVDGDGDGDGDTGEDADTETETDEQGTDGESQEGQGEDSDLDDASTDEAGDGESNTEQGLMGPYDPNARRQPAFNFAQRPNSLTTIEERGDSEQVSRSVLSFTPGLRSGSTGRGGGIQSQQVSSDSSGTNTEQELVSDPTPVSPAQ